MNFKNKKVLITGASRGIGRSTAIAFSKKGAQVGINYRSDEKAANSTLSLLNGKDHSLFKKDRFDIDPSKLKSQMKRRGNFALHYVSTLKPRLTSQS